MFAVAGTEESQVVLSHARSLSTPVAVAVVHNLRCLGRRSEERYKGEGFSSQTEQRRPSALCSSAQDGSFHDARQTTSALPGTLWLCWHPLASFELFMHSHPHPANGVRGLHWKDGLRPTIPATPHWLIPAHTQLYTELLDTHTQHEGQAKGSHEPRGS